MRARQEPLVFAVAALLLAALTWRLFSGGESALRGGARGEKAEGLKHYRAPDPAVALPSASATPPLARELFAPPSDTSPLPPLELIEPPRERLPALLPPTDPGPAPRAYGRLLRSRLEPVDLPDLFAQEEPEEVDPDAFLQLGGQGARRPALVPGAASKAQEPLVESPEERQARIQGYRRRYDWVQRGPGELWFGRIENEDRYGLKTDPARASEPLLFVRLNPDTGGEFYENIGAPPLPLERGSISDFDFAATVANEIEVRARRIGPELSRGSFDQALQLASYCVEKRLEAPRALAIAEELYRSAAAYDPKDPIPRLGLARCLEAAFRFEDAYAEYGELLASFGHREEVHVRLAQLEERFLLFDQAEQRLREAFAMNQGSWISRFALGRFLAHRGRYEEAVEHLRVANKNAPQEPDLLYVRVAIRTNLADALLALGEVTEAQAMYRSALSADAGHERARAGLLATEIFGADSEANIDGAPVADEPGAGFELLLARGVAALVRGEHEAARNAFRLAAEADPLREHEALGALSFLAESTGNAEEALRLAEEALQRDPTSPYALYQRGRLLGLQDDYEGARAALLAALEQELDFEDALVSLGEMAFRSGRFEDAERYLERALSIDDKRAEVQALRGLNLLRLNSLAGARTAFERALALVPDDPTGTAGLAWCVYLEGNPHEALIQLANIEERRRSEPEGDPWRTWARAQILRLQDHLQKVEWRDSFNRKRLANGWTPRGEDAGPIVTMAEGAVQVNGLFTKSGEVLVQRELPAGVFVSFEASLWIEPGKDKAQRIGLFARRERPRRGNQSEVIAEASVSRHKEGGVQVRFVRSQQATEILDMGQPFPVGRWVRLKLVRSGESSESAVTLFLDGIPLVSDVAMASLGQTTTPLLFGLFVEGETGREVAVKMDDASVVHRK